MAERAPGAPATIEAALRAAIARLRAAGRGDTPDLDARLLAEHAFGLDRTGLRLAAGRAADGEAAARFHAMVERRLAGEPVHRIIGRRAFYLHEFTLSPDTLEPRPDTEALVELTAQALRESGREAPVFADLGTGSGAIAVSLLALFPRSRCLAVDLSPGALAAARANARSAGVADRFWPVCGDFLDALALGGLDLVVSNPPYIPTSVWAGLQTEVREHDPRLALDGGADGLDAYRAIAQRLGSSAHAPRDILFEIGAGQQADVEAVMNEAGAALHGVRHDLGGHARALWFRCNTAAPTAPQIGR